MSIEKNRDIITKEEITKIRLFLLDNTSFSAFVIGLQVPSEPLILQDGRVVKAEKWHADGKEPDISNAVLHNDGLVAHYIKKMLKENNEITMVTGAGDREVSVRIFAEEPKSQFPETDLASEGREKLSKI